MSSYYAAFAFIRTLSLPFNIYYLGSWQSYTSSARTAMLSLYCQLAIAIALALCSSQIAACKAVFLAWLLALYI